MAAYAAVVSLMHITHQLERHQSPPVSLDKQQVSSLTENLAFLQRFLEAYNSPIADTDEADPLEMRIAEAIYAAEDAIESYIIDNINLTAAATGRDHDQEASCISFYEGLQEVIEELDLITKEAREMDGFGEAQCMERNVVSDDPGFRSIGPGEMVGFDDLLLQLLDRLTGGSPGRQVIPIVGAGGMGFYSSQKYYNIIETLRQVLSQARGYSSGRSENELGEALHKHLYGRRYLIIMDDMWSIDFWEKSNFCFPNCNNGSRVLVTTRLSNLAAHLAGSNDLLDMCFLDEVSSWKLFRESVFRGESFPLELEEIGKKIVKICKSLPLSIVVVGGLLAKSQQTKKYWEYIERNFISIPCFLYVGMYDEDSDIRVSKLIELWVAEGFLKPVGEKGPEAVAEEYIKELVDRNLFQVHKVGIFGNVKRCRMHDLLRDLSLKEAKKQRFHYVVRHGGPHSMSGERRIYISRSTRTEHVVEAMEPMPHARSCVGGSRAHDLPKFRLLRTLSISEKNEHYSTDFPIEDVMQLVNLRYLCFGAHWESELTSSISMLWNLQTLIICYSDSLEAPTEIWRMRQLKHLEFITGLPNKGMHLPAPPPSSSGVDDVVIMEDLHTLKGVINLYLNEEVVRRIPNVKKLVMTRFPESLKKLRLFGSVSLKLEDILGKIGCLPLLQKLVLIRGFFGTRKWETEEGQFPSLRILELDNCGYLEKWMVSDSSHFPRLQEVRLYWLKQLEEIPSEIGDIPTMKSIKLRYCDAPLVASAEKIVEEREELYGDQLELHVQR
ncbi:hypothetical protein OROHE_003948 [Orobanche hederae]